MTAPLYLNGRFLTRPATGVDRVAAELLRALALLPEATARQIVVLVPPGAAIRNDLIDLLPAGARNRVEVRVIGRGTGHLWEQWYLGRLRLDGPLLSLCSTGPLLQRHQAIMLHDAQVWDAAASFSWTFRMAYRLLLPILARRVQTVLTVSEYARSRLERHGVVRAGQALVIPNGSDHMDRIAADTDTLARHRLVRHGYFLVIASLAPHKNLRFLIEAAMARPADQPELVIAGGMNSRVFAAAGLGGARGVRFLGRVSDGELKALYQNALALAFPSLTEGFGLPPVEAMRCGCPALVTTGGAVPEVCGDAALFADPLDAESWRQAMLRLTTDPELRADLAARGLVHGEDFTWRRAAEYLLAALGPDPDSAARLSRPISRPTAG